MLRVNRWIKRNSSDFLGTALLIGGAVAILLATAGWLYFLGWLGWHLVNWILA
jgi:hypothetical protein